MRQWEEDVCSSNTFESEIRSRHVSCLLSVSAEKSPPPELCHGGSHSERRALWDATETVLADTPVPSVPGAQLVGSGWRVRLGWVRTEPSPHAESGWPGLALMTRLPGGKQRLSFRGRRTSLSTITINKVNSHKLQYRTFPSFPEAPAAWTEGAVTCSGPTPRSEHAPRADTRRWRSPPTSPGLNDVRDPGSDSPHAWPATAAPTACHVAAVCHAP